MWQVVIEQRITVIQWITFSKSLHSVLTKNVAHSTNDSLLKIEIKNICYEQKLLKMEFSKIQLKFNFKNLASRLNRLFEYDF